jgi:LacI family transcriptional regulator
VAAGRNAKPRPRLVDVAAASGVTVSIVSRVLNGDPTVSARPETRKRIIEAARELAYIPNAVARGLRRSRTMTIGVVLPNLAYAVNAEIIHGAASRAAAEGYVVLVADAEEFGPTGTAYEQLLMAGRVDGLMIASTTTGEGDLRSLSKVPLPVVRVNRRGDRYAVNVSVDDQQGVALLVDHLVTLGHTDIAHIAGPPSADTARRRRAGFVSRMAEHGLPAKRGRIVRTTMSEAGGYAAMQRLLSGPRRPTAVVTGSFASAVGALSAIAAAGLRVPDDVSVAGFHDAPIGEFLTPRLTTVRMPLRQMAEAAVETLVRLIDGEPARDVVVRSPAPQLIERDSTGPPPP